MKSLFGQIISRQIYHYQITSWKDDMPVCSTDSDQMQALDYLVSMQLA